MQKKMKVSFITSKENPVFKLIKRLTHPRKRKKEGLFLIEGKKFVEEALKRRELLKFLVFSKEAFESFSEAEVFKDIPIYVLSPELIKELSSLTTPQGEMAVLREPVFSNLDYNTSPVLFLDRIQDPSNLGAILRVADAAGCRQVFLSKGTADPYSCKSVRASAGSILHLSVFKDVEPIETLKRFMEKDFEIWATTPHNGQNLFFLRPPCKVLVILGNEASGIQKEILELAHQRVFIPIFGKAESLNVSVAAGIFLYYLRFAQLLVKF
jgi:TrmH family RNA methyltransferase